MPSVCIEVGAFPDIVAHRIAIVRREGPSPIIRVFDVQVRGLTIFRSSLQQEPLRRAGRRRCHALTVC